MLSTIFSLGSVTLAMKARRIMLHAGIPARVIKVDAAQSRYGCMHGVEVERQYYYDAVRLLRQNGIPYAPYPATPESH